MSHFGDYMDEVPVKISEKYKRPPRIVELPYSVTDCPARAKRLIENAKFSSTFERNVLSKLKELRSAKEVKKSERRHRLQLLEEAKQKKLDAIAVAEAEEKLKQLSVSEVSYPSTDEINAITTDDNIDNAVSEPPAQENNAEADNDVGYASAATECQPNILQPIQVQSNYPQNNLLDDPDPLQELKLTSKLTKLPQYNQNVEMLTYKDFENDTSSPFDNVELKTINDMELLAQVLQSQREAAVDNQEQTGYPEQPYPVYSNCATQAEMEGVTYMPSAYLDQPIQSPGVIYSPTTHYPMSNGYYMPESVCDNSMPMENTYMPNYHYVVPAQPFPSTDPYYNQMPTTSSDVAQVTNGSSYIPQPYYFHCPHIPLQYLGQAYTVPDSKNIDDLNQNSQPPNDSPQATSTSMKSRSRSVQDIVRELNEELVTNQSRGTELAVSPGTANSRFSIGTDRKLEGRFWVKLEKLPNPLNTLTEKQRHMCENIHSMGFPLDRVARMCSVVGDNDKKIIENLLLLGELMDLGFLESKAAEALVKHGFNRDKALDELVS